MTSHVSMKQPGDLGIIKEHFEETDEAIRKQYENMSYDEMSKRLADSYKQLSDILGNQDISSSSSDKTMDSDQDEDLEAILTNDQLDESMKSAKLTKLFWSACSSGDLVQLQLLLESEQYRHFIDVNSKDDDGTTPLIYASCFGKLEVARLLLAAGAKTDCQDAVGWSALMWATNNNHEQLVKILLDSGASAQTKSSKGRTVFDFVHTDNQKMVDILATNPRDSISSTSSIFGRNGGSLSSSSSNAGDLDFYYQSTVEGYDSFLTEESDRRKRLIESVMKISMDGLDDDTEEPLEGEDDTEALDDNLFSNEFQWDKCMPDQMFVFNEADLGYILDTVITNIQLPMRSQLEICIPANVIFLSSRFAHYFSSQDLLNQVLDGAVERMTTAVKHNTRNIHVLAFWITNSTQLLHYLKKDLGLVVATATHQLALSEFISETYTALINDLERRMNKIIGPALLEHDEIPGMEEVNFADDWQRFFRRNNRRSVILGENGLPIANGSGLISPPGNGVAMKRNTSNPLAGNATSNHALLLEHTARLKARPQNMAISPQSITSLLSSTLFVLQSYDVHPTIIIQVLAQFFHYLSCELFNRILTNKKMLCRSKALQIRMNLSHIEDWIRANELPASLSSYLTPTTQLLQLLQCLTQLTDLVSFINTVKAFDVLNALQVKRCVVNYRHEVNEPRLPEEIEKYAMQLAEDTVRHHQARNQPKKSATTTTNNPLKEGQPMARSQSQPADRRRESMSQMFTTFMGLSNSQQTDSSGFSPEPLDTQSQTSASSLSDASKQSLDQPATMRPNEDDGKAIMETRDSKFMLPFSVPTNSSSSVSSIKAKHEHVVKERLLVPVIPEDWMDKLDKGQL